jgi:hypothetical protein
MANIVKPGQSITVNGNPNGLPAFVPASMGDNLGLLNSPISMSIPKLTPPITTEPRIAIAHSLGSKRFFTGGSLYHKYKASPASTI